MNIGKEKKYIYNMMEQIIEERRILADERSRLTRIFDSLKERLERLEELELRGLEELSIKGYVDLHNEKKEKHTLENLEREISNLKTNLAELTSVKEKVETPQAEIASSVVPQFEISEQKWKEKNNKVVNSAEVKKEAKEAKAVTPKKKRRRADTKYIYNAILTELKNNSDRTFNASEMYDVLLGQQKFRDLDVDTKEFRSNLFYRVISANADDIEKIDAGRYQYIGKTEETV